MPLIWQYSFSGIFKHDLNVLDPTLEQREVIAC